MTWPPSRAALLLAAVLAASVTLWWPSAGELHVASDDRQMMAVSRAIAGGRWGLLLEFQDVHLIPLFRLVRLYFDLHFPAGFRRMHGAAIAAHTAATLLLFLLSRRYLKSLVAAIGVACLFGWHGMGAEAIFIKSQNTYVLSLPFLLGALYCLCRWGAGGRRHWAAGCFLLLVVAAGLHAQAAVPAIPAVLLGYYLLARRDPSTVAWAACGLPFALACAAWLELRPEGMMTARLFHGGPATSADVLARLWDGFYGTVIHFGFQVRQAPPEPLILYAAAAGLVALLIVLRKERSFPWVITGLALAALPVFVILAARGAAAYHHSRYCYQSFLAVAIAGGATVDRALAAVRDKPRRRAAILAVLMAAAPAYYDNQRRIVSRKTELARFTASVTRDLWFGWKSFFDAAAETARSRSTTFRLPTVEIEPGFGIAEVFAICNPRGLSGVTVLDPAQTTDDDCARFYEEARRIRELSPAFAKVSLPLGLCQTGD